MTKREKIKILKKMRTLLESGTACYFCEAWAKATNHNPGDGSAWDEDIALESIIALGLKRPAKSTYAWYNSGDPIRIRKIDELIKRLTK